MFDTITLTRLFDYHLAANRLALASLPDDIERHERAYKVFGHLVNVERRWSSRLADGMNAVDLERFPLLSKKELGEMLEENGRVYRAILSGARENTLSEKVAFLTSEGTPLEATVGEILFQVISHGSYHRGQVALLVGSGGGTSAATDFLLFAIGKI